VFAPEVLEPPVSISAGIMLAAYSILSVEAWDVAA
jgi:hypothetical protein